LDTKIYFIVLNSPQKDRIVCDLVEKCYVAKKKVVINVKDQQEGNKFESLLWNWKQSSFVPHNYIKTLNTSQIDPVVLTPEIETNPSYDILCIVEPVAISTLKKFATVIDFAEKYDTSKLTLSRERYKKYLADGIEIETMQPGEFLNSVMTL
jgi:DNA polymerase-3 subunit chi